MRPATLVLLVTLWISTIGNVALWRAMAALPELADGRGLAFMVAFGVGVAALTALPLALLAWRWTLKPVLALFLLAAAGGAFFMVSYGIVIDRTMMINVLLTDSREARDLLSPQLFGVLAVLLGLPHIRLPRLLAPAVMLISASSYHIYLFHRIVPELLGLDQMGALGPVASIAVGLVCGVGAMALQRALFSRLGRGFGLAPRTA